MIEPSIVEKTTTHKSKKNLKPSLLLKHNESRSVLASSPDKSEVRRSIAYRSKTVILTYLCLPSHTMHNQEFERRRYRTTLTATTATVQATNVVCAVDQLSLFFTAGDDFFNEAVFLVRGADVSSRCNVNA